DRALAIAAGRSEQTPWLVDTPPVSGDWHYAIAPVEPSGLGLPAPVAVTLNAQPVPTMIYADFPITVDGDLAEWRDALAAPPLVITPASGHLHGEPLAGPADLSASIRLARDSERLYVGALVRDDMRAHRHAWSWMGDGLVLCVGAVRAERGRYLPRYDLVLNYAAGEPPLGRILEDASGSYPADAKPVAPGSVAVKPTAGGYVLEAMLPLASLSAHGLDLNADEWLAVGLSIYDSDQREGETSRQTALSWNQRKQLYGAAEAALMRVERYP
ncbi:MAG: hypothetical protein HUU35_03640, partial [Armatimonadetes bacterium]|nr:hypothetical protein [Armatimonadota bacterium]